MPSLVKNYQTKALAHGFTRQYQAIQSAVNSLVVNENKADFFTTSMYLNETPESYADSSGKFIKKYLKVNKYCGDNNGDCFAPKYYEFKDNDKVEYTPEFKGACASLKNGMSLCLTPQIGNDFIYGIIDVNGKKGPNIKDKDLRTFTISPKSRIGLNTDTQEVYVTSSDLKPDNGSSTSPTEPSTPSKTACEIDEYSLDCCKTRAISGPTDACCTYDELNKTGSACVKSKKIVKLLLGGMGYDYTGRPNPNVPSPLNLTGENVPKGVTVSYSSNIASKSVQSDSGTIRDNNSYVMTSSNYPKNMSISIPEVSYTCSHTFSTAPNKHYCGGGSCLPRLDTRLYFEIEYMIDYANNFAGYTGRVSCYVLGDESVRIRKDF